MNDLERDVRAMFHRRDADLPPTSQPPPRIARRVRLRRLRTGVFSAITAVALVTAGALGYRALTNDTEPKIPATEIPATMTAYAGSVAITYPIEWQLTAYGDGSGEKVVLTNFEMDPRNDDPCASMPRDGVTLLVLADQHIPGDTDPPPWPAELRPAAAPPHCTGDDGGSGWSTPVGRTFAAQGFLGPNASEEDRSRLVEAFASMRFFSYEDGVSGSGAVLTSGVIDGRPWTLFAGPPGFPPGALSLATAPAGGGLTDSNLLVEAEQQGFEFYAKVMHGATYLVGGVSAEVARMMVSPEGADPFDVALLDLPATVGASFRAFVVPLQGAPRGTIATYDASGAMLSELPFSPGSSCSTERPCDGATGEQLGAGKVGDTRWELIERDGGVQLVDGEGTVLGSVEGTPDPLLMSAVPIGSGDDARGIPFGLAAPETTYVLLFSSGLPSTAGTAVLEDGTMAFWASSSAAFSGGAQILAYDSDCRLLGALSIDTGEPPAEPAITDCVT